MQQQQVFERIFKRENNSSDNQDFLKQLTEEYPYFSAANYFFLKQNFKNDPVHFDSQGGMIFFNNKFQLNKLLQETAKVNLPIPTVPLPPTDDLKKETENKPTDETVAAHNQTVKDEIIFEPLHASDYFASQGIKLSDDMLGTDKLGKQLKSFTAWLKTMKKVQPGKLGDMGAAVETAVQNLAEKSNKEEDIFTEAMAEAYAGQGKNMKAKEIYEKLSLLNPAKSAYFAAKIDSLK
jgi:hypothetical protein